MIPPVGNLLIAFLAVLASWLYPALPGGAPFDSEMFTKILQWLLTVLAGWNVKAAAAKSPLPTVREFLNF